MSTGPDTLPAERLRLLVEQLADEIGRYRGWQSKVARRIGLHRSYVSKITQGARVSAGPSVVEKVCSAMGLDRAFFYDELESPPNHRDFLSKRSPVRAVATTMDLFGGGAWEAVYWSAFQVRQSVSIDDTGARLPRSAVRELLRAIEASPFVDDVRRLATPPDPELTGTEAFAAMQIASDLMVWVLVWLSLNGVERPGLPVWPPDQIAELYRTYQARGARDDKSQQK